MKYALHFLIIFLIFNPLMIFGQVPTRKPTEPNLSGTVTISGSVEYDQTLTADTSKLTSSNANIIPTGFTYQWYRGGKENIESNKSTHKLGEADIGKTISVVVSASNCKGIVPSPTTASVKKAPQTTPEAPKMASNTTNSITLTAMSGAVYRRGSGEWQDTPTFDRLTAGTSYSFTQRKKETTTHLASSESTASNFSTVPETPPQLLGLVTISGTVEFNQTLTAVTSDLTSSLTGTKPTGFTYIWKRGTINIKGATSSTYKLAAEDIGNTLSVEVSAKNCDGSIPSPTTASVKKASQTTPEAPKMESNTTNSITLTTVSGAQYSKDNEPWKDTSTFPELKSGTSYSFTQRLKETSTHLASKESPASNFSTASESPPKILGTVNISGTVEFNHTLTAVTNALNSSRSDIKPTGFTYQWKRGTTNIRGATSSTYKLTEEDIGSTLAVEVSASNCDGSISSPTTASVKKASQITPIAPTTESNTTNSITLTTVSGAEYRMGSGTWQDFPTFIGLTTGTLYNFTQRMKETTTHLPSNESMIASFEVSRNRTVLGTVIDDYGDALMGVTVIVKGTNIVTITNANGTFTINFPTESATLVFSYSGFDTEEVYVSDGQKIRVRLWGKPKGYFYLAATGGVSSFGKYEELGRKTKDRGAFTFGADVAYFFKPMMYITDPYFGVGFKTNVSFCDVNSSGFIQYSYRDWVLFFGPAGYMRWQPDMSIRWLITGSAGVGIIYWNALNIQEQTILPINDNDVRIGGFFSGGVCFMISKDIGIGVNLQTVLGSFEDKYSNKRNPIGFGITGGINYSF